MCTVIQLVEVFYGSCSSQESISTIEKETIILTSNPGHNDKHRDKKNMCSMKLCQYLVNHMKKECLIIMSKLNFHENDFLCLLKKILSRKEWKEKRIEKWVR